MKKLMWRALFFLIPFLYSIYASSQQQKESVRNTVSVSFGDNAGSKKLTETCYANSGAW